MSKIRVLIADDHAIVRSGVRLLLESQEDMEVIAEAADGEECVVKTGALQPDVVLMDIAMPKASGLEATRLIREKNPETQVLALTMHENERYFFEIMQAGALGYVIKGATPAQLLAAVRAVHKGQAYLYPSLARKLLDEYMTRVDRGEESESYGGLTEREREVLRLIAQGNTNREIAQVLYLSINTVERHRSNIMGKLNMHSRSELVKYAIRTGLLGNEIAG